MTKQFYKWALVFLCLVPSLSHAVMIKVDDGGDATLSTGGTMTLRMAITAAAPGDTILINYRGNITLGTNLVVNKPLVILGPQPIHCTLQVASNVEIDMNGGGNIYLFGVNVQGSGFASSTTAIRVFIGTTLFLRDCIVGNNQNSGIGGGMVISGTLFADNCTIMNNYAGTDAGGVFISNACSATFTNCTFSQNGCNGTGGAILSSGTLNLMHCTFRENSCMIDGNDVSTNLSGSTVNATNCIFYHSTISGTDMFDSGGGVWNTTGGNTFTSNPPGGTFSLLGTDQVRTPAQIALSSASTMDGYGLIYWKLLPSSVAIDFGVSGSLPPSDCRRAPRVLYNTAIKPDGGAVEFTPYTVTNNSGTPVTGSLPYILSLLSGPSPYYVEFNVSVPSPVAWAAASTISSAQVYIDGYSQPGSAVPGPGTVPGTVTPAIPGYHIAPSAGLNVLNVTGNNSRIHGIEFSNVFNIGINYSGGNGHQVWGCVFVGGSTASLQASGVTGLELGGERHLQRNVFTAASSPTCINITGSSNINIQGNFIGPDVSGNIGGLPHNATGLNLANTNHVLIGGDHFRGRSNLFSSLNTGITFSGNVSIISILGNYFGLGYNGLAGSNLDNQVDGIRIAGTNSSVYIGKKGRDFRNFFANNDNAASSTGAGVKLNGASGDVHVFNNAFGLDPNNNPQPNCRGVWVLNSSGLNLGDGTPQGKNIICHSVEDGLRIEGNFSTGNYINKNFIGVNENNLPAPNHTNGIFITALAASNTILNNVVSQGLTTVKGIHVNVGGSANDIAGNLVGTDTTGNSIIGNEYGIYVESTQDGTLIRSNLVSGNAKDGIYSEYTNTITLYSNIIGLNIAGTAPLSNSQNGINIVNGRQMFIGNSLDGNQIGSNVMNGIRLQNVKNFNIVKNTIGTTPTLISMGNQQNGILIDNGCDTGRIGMMGTPADSNIIMFNNNHGILVLAGSQHIAINQNAINQNAFLGISLQNGTSPLPNDTDDTDPVASHGNAGQNYPVLGGAANCGSTGTTNVYGSINADASGNYLIEFYSVPLPDPSGNGEGAHFLGSNIVTVPSGLTQTFSFPVGTLPVGTSITATCSKYTGSLLSTSEFSNVVTVLPPFTADASVTQNQFCYGGTDGATHVDVIGGVTPFSFNWIWVGAGSVGTVQDNSGLYAGDYTCQVTDATGCQVYSDTITITQPPALVVTPTSTDETCSGASDGTATAVPTGGTGPYNFTWTEASSTVYANSGLSSNAIGLAPGVINLSIVDANGCPASASVTIAASSNFANAVISTSGAGCVGAGEGFADSSTGSPAMTSWQWDFGDGFNSSAMNPTHTYSAAGSFTVQLIVGNGSCLDTTTTIVTIGSPPSAVAGADQQFCSTTDTHISLAGTVTGATSYYWSATQIVTWVPDSTSLTTDAYFSGAAVSAGSMYFILTAVSAGCSTSDSLYATFTPPHSAYAGTDITVCASSPIVLNGTITGALTATWSGAGSFSPSATTLTGVTYTPTSAEISAGTATVTLTTDPYGACAVASDAVVINLLASPIAEAGTYSPVCTGSSVFLNGSGSTGAVSYSWETGGTTFASTVSTTVSPIVTTDYILTVTNAGSCTDQDTATITVLSPPDPSFSYPSAPFCINDASEVPTATVTGGYFDNADVTGVTMNTATGEIFPSMCIPGTYHIYHKLSTPCLVYDTILVTIYALPVVSVAEATADYVMCPEDTLHFAGTPSGGAFTPIFGLNTSTGEYVGYTALPGTHTITYTYTDATTGCSNSDSKNVLVNTSPTVSMSPTLASTYCPADGPVLLTGSPSGGAFALNGTFTSFSTYSYDPTTPGIDSIVYGYIESTTGCGGFSYQIVTVQSAPPTPVLSPAAPYIFCATSPTTLTVTNAAAVVTWYSDAALTSAITTGTGILTSALPGGSGTAYVTNSLGSGCASAPLSFTYTNYDFSGVDLGGPYEACPGSPTEIQMSLPTNVLYAWLPDSGINDTSAIHPVVISQTTHTYTVFLQINSIPGCSTYDSVQVVVAPCSLDNVTNAFSPDGDGVNDTWIIEGIDQHPDNKVTVFNRWGDKLLHFNGYNNSTVVWDGRYKGTLVASGTYYFVIEYPDDGERAAGWLQLNY